MSAYYNEGIQVIVGNGQNFPGTPRVSLIPFIQRAYDKGLLNFTTLPPGSISLAEIQNISTSKLLGRSTAGTGVIEELTIGTGLSLAGGILSSTATASPPGGSDTQIQYNNAGAFGGSSQIVANIGVTNTLDITGSGSTSATNALRVRNSSGTNLLTLNNASGATMVGADTSASTYVISATNLAGGGLFRVRNSGSGFEIGDWTGLGHSSALRFTRPSGGTSAAFFSQGNTNFTFDDNSFGFQIISNTTASKPALNFTGTGYSGGTATTTKPTLLIEPTGTTSTGWSTSGTKLGVNAESGFTGNLLDLQVNGSSALSVQVPSGAIANGLISGSFGVGSGKSFYWASGGIMRSESLNTISLYNNTATDFGRLNFGGTTSSFPAIKRNGTGIDIRLADDSNVTSLNVGTITTGATGVNGSLIFKRTADATTVGTINAVNAGGLGFITSYSTFNTGSFLSATVGIQGSGATSATSSFIVQNSSAQKALEIKDDRTIFGYNSSSQLTTALGDITTGAMGVGTRNNQFTFGAIDVGTGNGLRILSRSTGYSYIDGYTEGALKANNYDIIIGARVNNTGQTITGSTTAELGSNVQIGFEATSNPRALLSLNSTTRGFLPTRMTTTQRGAVTWVAGDAGMIIFNTTLRKLQVWNGSAWETITSV